MKAKSDTGNGKSSRPFAPFTLSGKGRVQNFCVWRKSLFFPWCWASPQGPRQGRDDDDGGAFPVNSLGTERELFLSPPPGLSLLFLAAGPRKERKRESVGMATCHGHSPRILFLPFAAGCRQQKNIEAFGFPWRGREGQSAIGGLLDAKMPGF